jgi:small-conductance mechanosensitive channel
VTNLAAWADWAPRLIWTAATLGVAWLLGHGVGAFLLTRLGAWLPDRHRQLWDGAAKLVRRRLPLWTFLIGVWIAAGYWPLTGETRVVLQQALFVLGALSITFTLASVSGLLVDAYGTLIASALPVSSLTRNIAWALVVTLGGLVILNGIGVSITPMLTALGVGGLAVALALQEPLANFFAGLFMTLAGQIRVGDYVKLDSGEEGYVVDFSWRSTRLRMLANNLVIVPNAKLSQSIIVNHYLPTTDMAVLVEVGVDYASDLAHVERVVVEVGRDVMSDVNGGVPEFEPFVRYHTFGDSSINFTVILRAKTFVDQYLVKHEFVKRLHARFNREGIVIPFPIRTIDYRHEPEALPRESGGAVHGVAQGAP